MTNNHLDYAELLRESRLANESAGWPVIRLALLGDNAVQQFTPLLRALFLRANIKAEIFEGSFDGSEFESLNKASALYAFKPDFVVILDSAQGLRDKYYQSSNDSFMQEILAKTVRIWDAIHDNCEAQIIQTNYASVVERIYGNYDLKAPSSLTRIVSSLNCSIVEAATGRRHVLLLDIENLASWFGRRDWFDERFWTMSKSFCAPELMPQVAKNIVDMVLSMRGRTVKCVILDLDNTLWGGVIGDEGVHGISISAHGAGEDFYRFQCFMRELKNRGILLAVCSKNEYANAVAPFEENDSMVLKLSDITVFVANWDNKAANIERIQKALNIGLDSMVFLDDNPFERNLVREMLPAVIVPELPEDPSEYVRAICDLNLFETSSHSIEDGQRTELYRVEAQREMARADAASFEDFLQSLNMQIKIGRFTQEQLPRIVQLLQRSNQFNLTTHRYTSAQCESMANEHENCLPIIASLNDRFGDHGLISIVVARTEAETGTFVITDWLMSCRVLKRGVEQYIMNFIFEEARARGLAMVRGEYIPTAKNGMVRDFFEQFGFLKTHENVEGQSIWTLDTNAYLHSTTFVKAIDKPSSTNIEK